MPPISLGLGLGLSRGSRPMSLSASEETAGIGPCSTLNYLSAPSGPQLGAGSTLAVLVWPKAGYPSAEQYACGAGDGSTGWLVGHTAGGGWLAMQRGLTPAFPRTVGSLATLRPHAYVLATGAGTYRDSIDGAAVVSTGYTGTYTPHVAQSLLLGKIYTSDGLSGVDLCAVAIWSSKLSDTDVRRLSRHLTETMRVPDDLAATAAFLWEAGRDYPVAGVAQTSRGTSPLLLTPTGTVARTARARLQLTDSSLIVHDNATDVAATGPARRRNVSAVTRFEVSGAASLTVGFVSPLQATIPLASSLQVLVNGVVTSIEPTAATRQTGTIALPSGISQVEIREGGQNNPSAPAAGSVGTYCVDVDAGTGRIRPTLPSAPARRLVVYGDSLACAGGQVSPTREQQAVTGWPAILRPRYPGRVSVEAWGARSLREDYETGGSSLAPLVAQLALLADGAANDVWLAIGTNDYGYAPTAQSAANFQTRYTTLLTLLRAALPSATIYAQTPLSRTTETANAFGDTLPAYRTAIANAVTAAAVGAILVEGTALLTTADMHDGVHPSVAGNALLGAAIASVMGL